MRIRSIWRRRAAAAATRFDDPLPDGCAPSDCSLREAVMAANGSAGSTITLAAGVYSLTIPGADDGAPNAAVVDQSYSRSCPDLADE
jgi:hypothetical protein